MLDISSSSTIHNLLKFTCSKQRANVYYHDSTFKSGIFIHKKHYKRDQVYYNVYIYISLHLNVNYLLWKFLESRMPEYRFRHYLPLRSALQQISTNILNILNQCRYYSRDVPTRFHIYRWPRLDIKRRDSHSPFPSKHDAVERNRYINARFITAKRVLWSDKQA